MKQTIFDILTGEEAREASLVEASLDKEFIAGAAWWSSEVLSS